MQVMEKKVSGEKFVLDLILSIQRELASDVETEGNVTDNAMKWEIH